MTNWYHIFYWLSVADNVKNFFDVFSNIFTLFSVILTIIIIIMTGYQLTSGHEMDDDDKVSFKKWFGYFRSLLITCVVFMTITWAGFVMVPSKKDCYVIVAGGAVGNFIQSDSSAQKIPSEALQLLRDKMRQESKELSLKSITDAVSDTLKDKSKEELIEIVKNQNKK